MVKECDSGVIFCSRVQSPESSPAPVTKPQRDKTPEQVVSLAAVVLWGGGGGGGALREIHKTAARETTEKVDKTT